MSANPAAQPPPAEPVYVFVVRPRCPDCGAPDPLADRSTKDEGDGTTTRRVHCRACGKRFILVLE